MNSRMRAITDAATVLFLRQGYAKTQISHIAREVGISVGTIYLDFTGKKAIMQFVLKSIIDPDFVERDLEKPISEDLFSDLENEVIMCFQQSYKEFAKHLSDNGAGYGLEELASDAFDLFSRYAAGCLFIEKNQHDFKTLANNYKSYRSGFFETMKRYFEIFIDRGEVRKLDQLELSVMLVIEILSWWAMDMRYTSFEVQGVPESEAKKVCIDNIVTAYKL